MQSKDAIRAAMDISFMVFKAYLDDLSDEQLTIRPAPGCNHPAWQIGHLISSEVDLLKMAGLEPSVELPDGFGDVHSKEQAASEDSSPFLGKEEYFSIFDNVRKSTLAELESLPEERLDEETPEQLRAFCPTVGHLFMLIATHPLMHAGQFVPLRRKLEKPVLF